MKRVALTVTATLAAGAMLAASGCVGATEVTIERAGSGSDNVSVSVVPGAEGAADTTPIETTPPDTTTTTVVDTTPSDQRTLAKNTVITSGPLTPKSVETNGHGLFFANNMMYSHTVTVYDRSFGLVKVIDDSVDLADWGLRPTSTKVTGSPVEMAFSSDGAKAYVSNYEMAGPGFSNPGNDKCSDGGWDNSFVYRIDTTTLEIDQVIEVGAVPKYVAVTPDNTTVLATNWCTYDMSVIDAATGKEVRRIDIGRFPRGIAVTDDSKTAYVSIMGGSDIAIVDLASGSVELIKGVGRAPRHLVLSPDGAFLYATLNGDGTVIKIDTAARTVVGRVASPEQPRSMTMAPDGRSLYVVNYESNEVSKIRTEDMTQLQRIAVGHHPIGITYDAAEKRVWVACYGGSLHVLDDVAPA